MGTTVNYHWTLPTVHSDASSWGGELNTTIGAIDGVVWNIEKVELAAIQGQLNPNALVVSSNPSTSTSAIVSFANGQAAVGQRARWWIYETTEAETGGNVGSNLIIQSYNDFGVAIGTVMECVRQTGQVGFNYAVSVTGTFYAVSTVSVGGVLNVTGLITANSGANITGQTTVNGNFYANVHYFGWPSVSDFLMNVGGTLRYLQWEANWYDGWNASGGLRTWVAAGTTIMSLDGGGNLVTNGNISSTNGSIVVPAGSVTAGTITATGLVQANNGQVISRAAGSGNAQFTLENNAGSPVGYCYWDAASNSVNLAFPAFSNSFQLVTSGDCYANPGSAGHNFVVTQGGALKPGGGSWGTWSDSRIKTVRGDYTAGLEAILQLRPVTYAYKGDYAKSGDGKEFVGLVADEAMKALPEMVSLQKGTIDGREVDDLKVLDTTSLIFALINSVKELKAEIEELKAAK